MPVGVLINVLAVFVGGFAGAFLRSKLRQAFKENLNLVFSVCSMAIGISSIVLMKNLPAVIFSMILGTGIYGTSPGNLKLRTGNSSSLATVSS